MSLRRKTFLIISVTISIIVVTWGLLAHTVFLNNYRYLEKEDIRSDAEHLTTALDFQIINLSALCADWAEWDDTYNFIEDRNPQYLQSNFVNSTFENLDLSLAILYDAKGNVIYGKTLNLNENDSNVPDIYLLKYFNNSVLMSQAWSSTITSFIYYNQTPMIYCISPILTSSGGGPKRGFLVFGKYLQGDLLSQIQNSIRSEISIIPYDAAIIPKGSTLLPIPGTSDNELVVNRLSSKEIEAYYFIDDFQHKPIFIIKQNKYRAIYQQGLAGLKSMLLAVILTGLTAGGAAMLILDKNLLSRISKLHNSVVAFRSNESQSESIQLDGNDELANLSSEFNYTINALVEKQHNINGFLQYTQLMTEISTKFINLPINKINQNLQEVLSQIGTYLDVDFGRIFIFDYTDRIIVTQFFEWKKLDSPSLKDEIQNLDIKSMRWMIKRFMKGEPVILSSLDDLPQAANHEREFLKNQQVSSLIAFPLSVADNFIGMITFGICGRNRIWDEQTPMLIKIIANIISNAIDRKNTELDMQASHKFQYRLNQVTKTSIERDNYNSSIRALSRNLRSLLNLDRNWLILLDETGKPVVYESGKRIPPDENVSSVIGLLLEKARKEIYVFQSSESSRKTTDFGIIGQSFIAIPLAAKNRHIGLIILANQNPHQFTIQEKNICQQAATQISLAIIKNQSLEESREISRDLRNLRSAVVEFSSELDLNKLQDTILDRAVKLLNAEGGEFYSFEDRTEELITVSSLNMDKDYKGMRSKIGEGAAGKALALRKTVMIKDYSNWNNRLPQYEASKIRASLSTPLHVGDKIIGCISVFHYNPTCQFNRNDQHLITIFAQHASIAMDNAILFGQIQEIARTDEMTGLLNRRALFEIGKYEISRSNRLNHSIAVVMMDLDNYKEINDTHSHIIGDKVLREISRLLQKNLRNIDIIGRYGGDEYVIIMPETNLAKSVKAMERIRQNTDKTMIKVDNLSFHVTACFGITYHEGELPSLEKMIEEADKAMYEAKNSGRNCVRVFQEL